MRETLRKRFVCYVAFFWPKTGIQNANGLKSNERWRKDSGGRSEGSSRAKDGRTEKWDKYVTEWCHCETGKVTGLFSVAMCWLFSRPAALAISHRNRMKRNKMGLYQLCISISFHLRYCPCEGADTHAYVAPDRRFIWIYIFILNCTMFLWQFSRKPQFWCWC